MGKEINVNEFTKDFRPAPESIVKTNKGYVCKVLQYDSSNNSSYLPIQNLGNGKKDKCSYKDLFLIKGNLNCGQNCSKETAIYRIKKEIKKYSTFLSEAPNVIPELNKELLLLEDRLD